MFRSTEFIVRFLAVSIATTLQAQETGAVLIRSASDAYALTELSDWSRYDDGKYVGHVYRETRAEMEGWPAAGGAAGVEYEGRFFVLEQTLRDMKTAARELDAVVPAAFVVAPDGAISMKQDGGQPSLRGFPAFPAKAVKSGDLWTARFTRAVDPFNDGKITVLTGIAEYRYLGTETYKGETVHRVFARYATRYRAAASEMAASIADASGTHEVDILIRFDDGLPLMMRDRLDETFRKQDGATVRYKGFTLTFAEGRSPTDRNDVVADLRRAVTLKPTVPATAAPGAIVPSAAEPDPTAGNRAGGSPGGVVPAADAAPAPSAGTPSAGTPLAGTPPAGTPSAAAPLAAAPSNSPPIAAAPPAGAPIGATPLDGIGLRAGPEALIVADDFELALLDDRGTPIGVNLEETDLGVKLVVRDLRFVADADEILPAERGRLDIIAAALAELSGKSFLVEGHTAAVGKPVGELDLSVKRAKRVVDELASRGIAADRFLYKGWGGAKPLAGNDTETGRAQNRRVEITILD